MKRPFPVTLTLWLVLILASWNALRAWTSLAWQGVLTEYAAKMPLEAGVISGILWFTLGLVLAFGLWRNKAWSAKGLVAAAAGYSAWYWSVRFLWQHPRPNALFAAVVNIACLALIILTINSMSREAYERNTENQAAE